eukprot:5509640-Prymnesium_polylepis.1
MARVAARGAAHPSRRRPTLHLVRAAALAARRRVPPSHLPLARLPSLATNSLARPWQIKSQPPLPLISFCARAPLPLRSLWPQVALARTARKGARDGGAAPCRARHAAQHATVEHPTRDCEPRRRVGVLDARGRARVARGGAPPGVPRVLGFVTRPGACGVSCRTCFESMTTQ